MDNLKRGEFLVDIENNPEVLNLIVNSVSFLPGWKLHTNIIENLEDPTEWWKSAPNGTPRIISFNMVEKIIVWWSNEVDRKSIYGGTVEKMSKILEKLYEITMNLPPS